MKNRIANKLFKGLAGMLAVIALIAITGLICIQVLKNTANNIVVEYIELNAVQELRLSINQIYAPAHEYLYHHEEHDFTKFEYYMSKTYSNIDDCTIKLSNRHNKYLIIKIKQQLELFYQKILDYSMQNPKNEVSQKFINDLEKITFQIHSDVQSILAETEEEIDEYIVVYETSSNHSRVAIIGFTFILIFVGFKWGSRFARSIINPIESLVNSTKSIASGNLKIRSTVNTNDELKELSDSFNGMINELEKITVSRNYFDNIISSMSESLIISDTNGTIMSCNNATLSLLNYESSELIGKNISLIMLNSNEGFKFSFEKFDKLGSNHNVEIIYVSKENTEIPVLFSFSTMQNENDNLSRIIFTAHDLRERINIEQKLNQERREHLIAINEAQEKERLKIATEIHDGLGQMLTGISYSIENYFIDKHKDNEEYNQKIVQLHKQIDNTIKESKNIAYDLMPFLLKDFGLVTAIENLIKEVELKNKTKFQFEVFNCEKRFDEKLEKALYRIIQEAVNNIIKHSKASKSNIQIIKHIESISVVIEDNGVGFEIKNEKLKTKHKGIGLISMKERVSAFNGFININSVLNQGTEIVIELPCFKSDD